MIAASQDLTDLIASRQFTRVDLYAISPKGLPTLYWTSADIAVAWGGNVYQPVGMLLERGKSKLVVGLETDSLDLKLYPGAAETAINGVPLRQAAQRGILDGADVRLSWAYVSSWGPPPVVVGALLRFIGNAGAVVVGQSSIDITVNSPLKRLDVPVPTKVYGPACRWTLGDGGCGVDLSAWAQSVTLGENCTDKHLMAVLPAIAQGWAGGKAVLSTGLDTGVRRAIGSYADGVVTLATPLPWAPSAGDVITVYPGCDKTLPQVAAVSGDYVIGASGQITVSGWSGDMGVMLGTSSTQLVWYDEYGVENAPWGGIDAPGSYIKRGPGKEDWSIVQVVEKVVSSSRPMASVAASPGAGQYSVSNGVYSFAAADVGKTVHIAFQQWIGGGKSCAIYNNVARFGGQPFIPAPETAY